MQLAHHHTLGAVDHECALRRHQRDFAHVNLFFLRSLLFAQLKGDVQWGAVRLPFTLRFEGRQFWLADIIVTEIENCFFIVAFDGKNFFENSLEPVILSFRIRDIFLEKIDV